MKAYRKTTKRHSDTLRVLAQLHKPEPQLLRELVSFLKQLWELGEKNDLLIVDMKTDDGLQVYHDRQKVFYMHLNRKRWALLMLNKEFKMYKPESEQPFLNISSAKNQSHDQQWRLCEKAEFDTIIKFISGLKKGKRYSDSKRRRRIPIDLQKIILDRFEKNGGVCENPNCPVPSDVQKKDGFVFHIDHILPFSRKGTSKSVDNLQVLCAHCNQKKNKRLAEYCFR
ncbi:MAG: HNH endonuclease signature motif containing protein [Candidatus Desulfaltia sp.]|nr:HNH endonuclease signature motif containing protein [Candidatus Desulfaltia sp.]